jgi:hypothetical protein
MSNLRIAAQQALEALDWYAECAMVSAKAADAASALRAALEQTEQEVKGCDHCNHPLYAAIKCRVCGRVTEQEQEPVAWMYVGLNSNNIMHGPHLVWRPEQMDAMSAEKGVNAVPLYAALKERNA